MWHGGRAAVAAATLCAALAAVGCGGDKKKDAASPEPANMEPPPYCNAVEERRALGDSPPELAFALRNIDVDNFSGATASECNERQIVYWGPPPPVAALDRAAVTVRLFFTDDPEGALRLAGLAEGKPKNTPRIDGVDVALTPGTGEYGAHFVTAAAVVDITVGCVPAGESFGNGKCASDVPIAQLEQRLKLALKPLVPALQEDLGAP